SNLEIQAFLKIDGGLGAEKSVFLVTKSDKLIVVTKCRTREDRALAGNKRFVSGRSYRLCPIIFSFIGYSCHYGVEKEMRPSVEGQKS
ncbi:MAG: hypothetical protein LBB84_10825, partial [Tannerellaceae bacterium]|nr:hypothetical protein [Tannerellaceae bacterium]